MITIYHNPRCTKSREGVQELENLKLDYTIRKYLEEPFTKIELESVLKKLNYKPLELVRTKEKVWIENFKNKNLSDEEIIEAMLQNPKLIERPIIVSNEKAIVARPLEKLKQIV